MGGAADDAFFSEVTCDTDSPRRSRIFPFKDSMASTTACVPFVPPVMEFTIGNATSIMFLLLSAPNTSPAISAYIAKDFSIGVVVF